MYVNWSWTRGVIASVVLCLFCLIGCAKPQGAGPQGVEENSAPSSSNSNGKTDSKFANPASADANDVKTARARIDALGSGSRYAPKDSDVLTEIVIQDGSNLKAEDLTLFGNLRDLETLQIFNCRALNDEMAAHLSGLKRLKTLALTNSVINDASVEMILKSFPDLTNLDLSSNTNLTNGVLKIIGEIGKLQRLTLVQNKFNDIGTRRLSNLRELRSLDLRGNMEAGDMSLEVVADLPKLSAFKHRSTAVTDAGLEYLGRNQTLESLLMQDFGITDQSGPSLAKLPKLSQLEIFRCQGFGSEGLLALKGMKLTRLTLRDLPNIDDRAMEVFNDLPQLRRLYLHELTSVSDAGLQHLSGLASLELLDTWNIPQMTDATVDVIAQLSSLKELSIRATDVSDESIDKLLKIPTLQSLTFKENGQVTAKGLEKLATKKWSKLDVGKSDQTESNEAAGP